MKSIGAVAAALAIFIFAWVFIAGLINGLTYFYARAGVGGNLFYGLNYLLVCILSPLAASAIAVYSSITTFKGGSSLTIFVAFVSVCASFVSILLISALLMAAHDQIGRHLFLFIGRCVAIFVGARLGRSLASSSENDA